MTTDYEKLCLRCYFFNRKDGVCDSKDYGYPQVIDNNGKKPKDIDECDIFTQKRQDRK